MILPHDVAGAGPAVVLLHAGVADRREWADHLAPLAQAGYRAVALDLPGFGEAPPADAPVAPWLDVLETMEALGIERAVLVGNSWGAGIALRSAVAAPDRVRALVLVSGRPVGGPPSDRLGAAWEAEMEAFDAGDLDGALQAVLEAWTLPDGPPGVRERVAVMQRHTLELEAARVTEEEPAEAPDPLEPFPESVAWLTVPALIIDGEHDMPDFHQAGELLAATLPAARRVVIAGAGHLAPLEAPEEFRRLVLGFLAGHRGA